MVGQLVRFIRMLGNILAIVNFALVILAKLGLLSPRRPQPVPPVPPHSPEIYSPANNDIEFGTSDPDRFKDYTTTPGVSETPEPGYIAELNKLADLRAKGVLTEEEFQKEKKEILYRANQVEMIKCAYCGSPIEAYVDKCPTCGAPNKTDKST